MGKIVLVGEITPSGELKVDLPKDLPPGRVTVIIEDVGDLPLRGKGGRLGDVLNSGLIGSWSHRSDIDDSVEFARDLRHRASRGNNPAE